MEIPDYDISRDYQNYYYEMNIKNNIENDKINEEIEENKLCQRQNLRTRIIDSYVNIDSRNRDVIKYPNINEYEVYLEREYINVKEIKIVSSQFPNTRQNIFSDPISIKNNHFYWQNWDDTCFSIYDYNGSSTNVNVVIDRVPDILFNYLFDDEDENNMRLLLNRKNANRVNSFEVSLDDVVSMDSNRYSPLRFLNKDFSNYTQAKILNSASMNGIYNILSYKLRFYYFGPDYRDCMVLLCVNLSRVNNQFDFVYIYDKVNPSVDETSIKTDIYGYLQFIDTKKSQVDYNRLFETKMVSVDPGFYEGSSLSLEIKRRITSNEYVYNVVVDEKKNITRLSGSRRNVLGIGSIFYRGYNKTFERFNFSGILIRKFIVVFKCANHRLMEGHIIRIENNDLPRIQDKNILDYIIGKDFSVHLLKLFRVNKADKVIFRDTSNMIFDISDFDTENGILYPISQNYFYIDLEEHYTYSNCIEIFQEKKNYGMNYYFEFNGLDYVNVTVNDVQQRIWQNNQLVSRVLMQNFRVKNEFEYHSALDGTGLYVFDGSPTKLLFQESFSMDNMLGFKKMDIGKYIVSSVSWTFYETYYKNTNGLIETATYIMCYSPSHGLKTGDKIDILLNKKVTSKVIRYKNIDYFYLEDLSELDFRDTSSGYFNINPIRFYDETDTFILDSSEYVVRNDYGLTIKSSAYERMTIFFENSDIMYFTNRNGMIYFCRIQSEYMTFYKTYYDSQLDINRIYYESIFGTSGKLILQKNYIIKIRLYNHSLLSKYNTIMISGYTPINGEYEVCVLDVHTIIVKLEREYTTIVSRQYAYNQYEVYVTSDNLGFYTVVNNLDLFGNNIGDIKIDSVPYIFIVSNAIGGGMVNVMNRAGINNNISNIFARVNLPDKILLERRTIYERHVRAPVTYAITPLPNLSRIDFKFVYPNGVLCDFKNTDHSLVLLIREYYDTNTDVGFSTKRGLVDEMNMLPSFSFQKNE